MDRVVATVSKRAIVAGSVVASFLLFVGCSKPSDESPKTPAASATPAATAVSPAEQKKKEFIKVARKMGPGDLAMAAKAIELIDGGIGWSAADDLMREAGSETRVAYREWRKAAVRGD